MSVATWNIGGKHAGKVLWAIQGAMALLFLFAGGMKLAADSAEMAKMSPLPVAFLRFIGVVEVLGALGLILPGLVGVLPRLTSLAAGGLAIIMVGGVVVTLFLGGGASALVPGVVGLLVTYVAYRRSLPVVAANSSRWLATQHAN